jgi:glycine/D-amino acid oxidase-like deaminating enzyme
VALDAQAVAERIRSPVFRRGVYFPDGATVQPARLVHALRRAALDSGVLVYEHTPALRIRAGLVGTPHGSVRAPEIVVAVNAAATGWRQVARHVTNFGSYVVLTEPVPELLEEIGWTGGEAVLDARMFLHYFRTTADGRVLMGSGSGPIGFRGRVDGRFSKDDATAARAEHGLRRLLPGLAEARIERAWGGPIDVSADHLPFFGTVKDKRIHYGLGYSGHGVGPTWLGGQILASLVLRREDEWTALPLASRKVASLPPEPFKHVGGALVRSSILACERADEENRRAPLPARLGAALPRLFGMEIGTR